MANLTEGDVVDIILSRENIPYETSTSGKKNTVISDKSVQQMKPAMSQEILDQVATLNNPVVNDLNKAKLQNDIDTSAQMIMEFDKKNQATLDYENHWGVKHISKGLRDMVPGGDIPEKEYLLKVGIADDKLKNLTDTKAVVDLNYNARMKQVAGVNEFDEQRFDAINKRVQDQREQFSYSEKRPNVAGLLEGLMKSRARASTAKVPSYKVNKEIADNQQKQSEVASKINHGAYSTQFNTANSAKSVADNAVKAGELTEAHDGYTLVNKEYATAYQGVTSKLTKAQALQFDQTVKTGSVLTEVDQQIGLNSFNSSKSNGISFQEGETALGKVYVSGKTIAEDAVVQEMRNLTSVQNNYLDEISKELGVTPNGQASRIFAINALNSDPTLIKTAQARALVDSINTNNIAKEAVASAINSTGFVPAIENEFSDFTIEQLMLTAQQNKNPELAEIIEVADKKRQARIADGSAPATLTRLEALNAIANNAKKDNLISDETFLTIKNASKSPQLPAYFIDNVLKPTYTEQSLEAQSVVPIIGFDAIGKFITNYQSSIK